MVILAAAGCRSAGPVPLAPIAPSLPQPTLQQIAYTEPSPTAPAPLTAAECVARATTAGRLDGQSIELLTVERNLAALTPGSETADKAELAFRAKLLDLGAAAEKSYWAWYGAVAAEKFRTDAVRLADELRDRSRELLKSGLVTVQDLARIEGAALDQHGQLLAAKRDRRQAESRLAELLDLAPCAAFAFTAAEPPADAPPWTADESVAAALAQRPELRGAFVEFRSTPDKGKHGKRDSLAALKSERAWLTYRDLQVRIERATRDAHADMMTASAAKRLGDAAKAAVSRRVDAIEEKSKDPSFGDAGERIAGRLELAEAEAAAVRAAVAVRGAVAELRRQRGEILAP